VDLRNGEMERAEDGIIDARSGSSFFYKKKKKKKRARKEHRF
jgi:hypothetical protein